ncbi:hypothetical protein GS580_16870 [Rhodococcus hoagii]|nr:hypothetical protein [Prescottella equi]NKS12611.1 hypothetical protein [Prescottella equi]
MATARWDDPQVRHIEPVPLGTIVTHAGSTRADGSFSFAEEPKWRSTSHDPFIEFDVSMIEGKWTVDEAWQRIRRMTAPLRRRKRDAVRYFLSDHLFSHQYEVARTPTRNIPEHVSVYADLDELVATYPRHKQILIFEEAHHSWWSRPERVTLEAIELERVRNDDAG